MRPIVGSACYVILQILDIVQDNYYGTVILGYGPYYLGICLHTRLCDGTIEH